MLRKLLPLLFLISIAKAQTGVVSATVVDSDSTAWANGKYTISYTNLSGVGPVVATGTMNGSGLLSQSLNYTLPGYRYTIVVCPNASSACGTYSFTLSTATLDISAPVNSIIVAPRFRPIGGAYGYNDTEAQLSLTPGSLYWNVTLACPRIYDGAVWACQGSVPSGIIGFILSGSCPAGWTENDSIAAHYIVVTTTASGNVGVPGGSNSYTPTGTVAAPTFSGSAATLTGSVAAPTFTGSSATLTGSVAAPTFTGSAATLTGSVSTPTFTGTASQSTSAVSAGTPSGRGGSIENLRIRVSSGAGHSLAYGLIILIYDRKLH